MPELKPNGPPKPITEGAADSSLIAVAGIYVELLRLRFSSVQDPNFIFRYDPDPKKTRLAIFSTYDYVSTERNKEPRLVVSCHGASVSPLGIGSSLERSLSKGIEWNIALERTTIMISCIARKYGELQLLADTVKMTILEARMLLPQYVGIHYIGYPQVSPVTPKMESVKVLESIVSFETSYIIGWEVRPNDPLVQDIYLKLQNKDADYYTEIALGASIGDQYLSLKSDE